MPDLMTNLFGTALQAIERQDVNALQLSLGALHDATWESHQEALSDLYRKAFFASSASDDMLDAVVREFGLMPWTSWASRIITHGDEWDVFARLASILDVESDDYRYVRSAHRADEPYRALALLDEVSFPEEAIVVELLPGLFDTDAILQAITLLNGSEKNAWAQPTQVGVILALSETDEPERKTAMMKLAPRLTPHAWGAAWMKAISDHPKAAQEDQTLINLAHHVPIAWLPLALDLVDDPVLAHVATVRVRAAELASRPAPKSPRRPRA